MKNKYIIAVIIVLVLLFFVQYKEHADSTPGQNLSNEAIQNIAKVYSDSSSIATFNNLNVTGTFNIIPQGSIIAFNSATAPKGWAVCDGQKYKLSGGVAVVDSNGIQTPDLRGRFIRSTYATTGSPDINGDNVPVKISKDYDLPLNTYDRDDTTNKVGKMLEHKFGDYGGTDWRVQAKNELTKHNHIYRVATSGGDDDQRYFDGKDPNDPNDWQNGGKPVFDRGEGVGYGPYNLYTNETGEKFGMGVQPPYYVLTYIMKI
jgi:hypothetical protein